MTTILVVDDHPTNRQFLVTLLGYKGHRLVEAADGAEGLAAAYAERPDLIITDILMPTMDGYEFVRQLRADPTLSQIPIIFYTAYYQERAARALAAACGVSHILTKPSKPEPILQTVDAALGLELRPVLPPPTFDREHLRLVTDKLSEKVEELRQVNERLSVLVDINLQLASERDPQRLLQNCCQAARDLVGASYAIVSLLADPDETANQFFSCGLDAADGARLGAALLQADSLASSLARRSPALLSNPEGNPLVLGLPADHRPIHSLLLVPIMSPDQFYGWLCLFDKIGGLEFSAEDEQLAISLAALAGRVYEHRRLDAEVRRHEEQLKISLHEKEVLLKEVHHRVKNNLQAILNLLYMQGRYIQDEATRQVFQDTQFRIKSIALVHEKLYQTTDLGHLNFAEYLDSLARYLLDAYGVNSELISLRTETNMASMDLDTAVPLGIIITELVSNALKYAFPNGRKGEIRVELLLNNAAQLDLTVSDNGIGLPAEVNLNNASTLGLQLVSMLAGHMHGQIELDRTAGTTFKIQFTPL